VSNRRPTLPEGRTAAVEELFVALDAVMHTYRTLPDHERDQRMSLDAAVITGEIARRLALARSRISADRPPLGQAS
jgi:hypothetical protein